MHVIAQPYGIGKCHGKARFAAQFRRTQRLKTQPYSQANARELFGMPDVTAELDRTTSQTADAQGISGDSRPALDARYGQIGISAVAAAVRYQGLTKNLAYAPAPNDWRIRYAEELA
jgi:hypothetical protein